MTSVIRYTLSDEDYQRANQVQKINALGSRGLYSSMESNFRKVSRARLLMRNTEDGKPLAPSSGVETHPHRQMVGTSYLRIKLHAGGG